MLNFAKITLPIAEPLRKGHPVPGPPPPPGQPPPGGGSGNPGTVTQLIAWYVPTKLPAVDGSEIATWPDSPNLYPQTPNASPGSRPTVKRNAVNGISAANLVSGGGGSTNGFQWISPFYPNSNAQPVLIQADTWSVFAVFKISVAIGSLAMFFGDGGNFEGARLDFISDGLGGAKLRIVLCDIGNFDPNESFSLNAWHYVLVESDRGLQNMWIDGARLTGLGLHTMVYQSGTLAVGGTMQGLIAEMAFYNKAIGPSDRLILFKYAQRQYQI